MDVDKPDEKSIMTYVAKFLEKYPAGDDRKKVRFTELFRTSRGAAVTLNG